MITLELDSLEASAVAVALVGLIQGDDGIFGSAATRVADRLQIAREAAAVGPWE